MGLREAAPGDINGVVDVVLVSMPLDPQWVWRFPKRQRYPEEHRKHTQKLFAPFLDPANGNWHVMVEEAPSIQDPEKQKIVAFAVWDVSYMGNKRFPSASSASEKPSPIVANTGAVTRPDAIASRVKAFRETCADARERYFKRPYPNQSILHLQNLATHPEYMRRGHARRLCNWGLTKALDENLAVSVIASPMGKLLYHELGFEALGSVTIAVPGDKEKVVVVPMLFNRPTYTITEG